MKYRLPLSYNVLPSEHGARLDTSLHGVFPDMGVRARRRLWEWCTIAVNGKPQQPGYFVAQGDHVEIVEKIEKINGVATTLQNTCSENPLLSEHFSYSLPKILTVCGNFIIAYKPSQMHTAKIDGKNSLSFEHLFESMWRNQCLSEGIQSPTTPILLTRLDFLTSGVLLVAKNDQAQSCFRQWEKEGSVEKSYLAWVHGKVSEPFVATKALHVSKRSKTSVSKEDAEKTRRSYISPLAYVKGENIEECSDLLSDISLHKYVKPLLATKQIQSQKEKKHEEKEETLAKIVIHRGARHQIRVHMAHAKYPLVGDPLYGTGGSSFFLHHYAVTTPEFFYNLAFSAAT